MASDAGLHPPSYPWDFKGFNTYAVLALYIKKVIYYKFVKVI
jgi:hypothetical protein